MDITHINKLLSEGKTVSEVRKIVGLSEKKFQKEVKDLCYKFNQKLKQYEPITTDDKGMTTVLIEPKEPIQSDIILSDDNSMTISIQEDLKNNIVNLANSYDRIQEVLNWFESRADDKGMTEVIEVIQDGIKINLSDAEVIRTTIRINKDTWDKFTKFCEDNKEFNKQDLHAQALEEYIKKYK